MSHEMNGRAKMIYEAGIKALVLLLVILTAIAAGSMPLQHRSTSVLFAPSHVAALAANWKFITLDSAGDVGNDTSIAVDSNDRAHISYYDRTNGDLKYATNAGGSWATYTLDSVGNVGMFTSIAVDSNNKVHISYLDWTNADLKYATNASGSWAYYTIDSTGNVGLYSSIAVDSNNNVHISYFDWTNNVLKYATNEAGSWATYTVDNDGDVGYYTSIAVDSQDKVHISYGDWTMGEDLKYATNENGTWESYTIDSEAYVGYDTSIAVDSNDRVYISYDDEVNGNLKYATNRGGSWATYTLDNLGDVGLATSIALDSNDKIHISYCDYTDFLNNDLKYATNEGGSWEYHALDTAGNVGWDTSIAVDSKDMVHISYTDLGNGDLKYAYGTERTVPSLDVSFNAFLAPGQSPLTVQFTSSVIGGFEPYNYSWSFGDGGTSYIANPMHEYAAAGTYEVALVVMDSESNSKAIHNSIRITEEGAVTPVTRSNLPLLELVTIAAIISVVVLVAALIHSRRGRPAPEIRLPGRLPQPSEPRLMSTEEKLLRLKSMKDEGRMTEEEYERQKKGLVEKW